MIFPAWVQKGDTIGVTACSAGKDEPLDGVRLNSAAEAFASRGFHVVETANVRTNQKGRSSSAEERAEQLHALAERPDITWVIQAAGGDYLGEMLSYLDFERIVKNPKWYQGYSDPTGLLFTITTNCDMATVYASNFADFGMKPWHCSLEQNVKVLEGAMLLQRSFPLYHPGFVKRVTGYEDYQEDTPVEWKVKGEPKLSGRMIGGCMDVLLDLVGTRFDHTREWCEKYRNDGILWYLESFALSSERLTMGLWHLKEAGWFDHASGFVFGRPCFYSSENEISYEEAVMTVLEEAKVPVVFDADIGHQSPRMTIVNGALAEVEVKDGAGQIQFRFE